MPITRRELLVGGAALATGFPTIARAAPRLALRLLETSDLHMFVLDWDYYHARPDPTVGLSKIASLVAQARAQAPNALLFDNGDLLQGSPLGDYVARDGGLAPGAPHPVFRAMNHMRYDAATLGNHEFNFGLDFLERALGGAAFPYVGANIERADGEAFLPPFRILTRKLLDDGGVSRELRIGVIGFAPPQIMIWDKSHLEGRLRCGDMVAAARRYVPILRERCDVLVALCHSGIDARAGAGAENACLQIAAIPGVDAIMMGHAHRVFPGPDYAGVAGVDAERGTLAGVPAVMPGFWGSHLGVIDLTLARDGDRWIVDTFETRARPIYQREAGKVVVALADADPAIATIVAPEHEATRRWVDEPIGEIATPLFSYFVWIGIDPVGALVNAAQIAYARPLLEGTPHAKLPLLSAVAPFRAGYTPDAYIDLKPGGVALRHVADIYPYPNTLVAVRVTGAQLREWLECAARVFRRIDRDAAEPQLLIDRRTPSYNFDVIAGLEYRIDVSAPARYDSSGNLLSADAARIVDLRHNGRAIDPAQEFVVVTNNYRADGGGKFPGLDGRNIVLRAPDSNRDAVERFLRRGEPIPNARPWSFAPLGRRVTVAFDSAPTAARRLAEAPGLRATMREEAGYSRYEYDLA